MLLEPKTLKITVAVTPELVRDANQALAARMIGEFVLEQCRKKLDEEARDGGT